MVEKMRELGHRPAQCFVERDLLGRVRQMIVAANHVRDLHQRVIDHDDVVVDRDSRRPQDDGIAHCFVGKLDDAAHDVVKADRVLRNAQANRGLLSCSATAPRLGWVDATTCAGIERRAALGHGSFAVLLQLFLRAEAQVSFAFAEQALGMVAINFQPITLAIRGIGSAHVWAFVPIETKPLQVFEQLRLVAGFAALQVGVFDAQDHRPVLLARE